MNAIKTRQFLCPIICDRVRARQEDIHRWLNRVEAEQILPLYTSVDIRDAGFKAAVVDTNLFPAGFNNLCEHGLTEAVGHLRQAVIRRVPSCRDILIIAEEHTRNPWYLENVRILKETIEQAGFSVRIATFLSVEPAFCEQAKSIELETATGVPVRIYCFRRILEDYRSGRRNIDLIILNNDLTGGVPDLLKGTGIPVYPSLHAGWHARKKSCHFAFTDQLIREFAAIVDLDPWLFSCLSEVAEGMDINSDADRGRIKMLAERLFDRIRQKYAEHDIDEKPYLVLKADSGTYGMGIMMFEDPEEILALNRKGRNKLHKGKGAQIIHRYLLQEGVPTVTNIDEQVCEAVLYQVENNLIGGFYRYHSEKSSRENLNSKGMGFKKMCPQLPKYGECCLHQDINMFDIYRILSRVAAVAARREILHLEARAR